MKESEKIFFAWNFIEFLKEYNSDKQFLADLKKEKEEFEMFSEKPKHWIRSAFTWSRTKEGFDFWDELDNLWQNKLKENETKNIFLEIFYNTKPNQHYLLSKGYDNMLPTTDFYTIIMPYEPAIKMTSVNYVKFALIGFEKGTILQYWDGEKEYQMIVGVESDNLNIFEWEGMYN